MSTATLDIKIDSRDVPNATRQLQQLEKAGASAEKGVGSMRGAMQNLSYQLQDVAVQAQMGTSGLTIFAQQGPQIASVFGPAGAAVGAVAAIGAMIVSMGSSARETALDLGDLMAKADEMTITQLKQQEALLATAAAEAQAEAQTVKTATNWGYLNSQVKKGVQLSESQYSMWLEGSRKIEIATERTAAYTAAQELIQSRMDGTTQAAKRNAAAFSDLNAELDFQISLLGKSEAQQAAANAAKRLGIDILSKEGQQLQAKVQFLHDEKAAIDANEAAQRRMAAASEQAARAAEQQAKADARKREMQLQSAQAWLERANQLGATELEQIDYWHQQELAKLREFEQQKALTAMEVDTARKALDEESARRRMELEGKVLQKSLEASRLKAQAEKQATTQMSSMQWGLASQSLDAISMAAEEGSTMQKAAFIAGKGMAAAQAVMQAELASVSTLAAYAAAAAAAGPGGPALLAAGTAQAAAMKTMGYASAAIIAAQGFAGMFDNGGSIGSGQWGIVGENGPEIVKGPVNVTSRKKTAAMAASAMEGGGGGMSVTIIQNINGNGDQALAEVVSKSVKTTMDNVQKDFSGNGRLRKTLGV